MITKRGIYLFIKNHLVPASLRPRFSFWCRYVLYNRWYRFYIRGIPNFIKYVWQAPNRGKKKVLAFENFRNNSPALGSFMEFLMRAMCLSELHKIDTIDVALVYDLKKPLWDPKMSKWMSTSNFQLHLYEILPLLNMNPKLGSVFVFNSKNNFDYFLSQHKRDYALCPSLFHYVNGGGHSWGNYLFVRNFYQKKGYLPQFIFKPNIALWAKAFIKKYAGPKYAVTVNLRMNPFFGDSRNSDIPAWRHLFKYCLEKHPDVTFLLLARQKEAPEDIKGLLNIVFVKDHQTTMEQDMGLVRHALFHMGVVSGPSSFTNYTDDVPYCVFRVEMFDRSYNYNWHKPGSQWPWANKKLQKLLWEKETAESLVHEFEHLFQNTDKETWRKKVAINDSQTKVLDWPYIFDEKTTNDRPTTI